TVWLQSLAIPLNLDAGEDTAIAALDVDIDVAALRAARVNLDLESLVVLTLPTLVAKVRPVLLIEAAGVFHPLLVDIHDSHVLVGIVGLDLHLNRIPWHGEQFVTQAKESTHRNGGIAD